MSSHAARAHAKLSPSSAHRWIECPGSVRLSAGIEQKSSMWADEGTAAHILAEKCLTQDHNAVDFLGWFVDVDTGRVESNLVERDRVFIIDDEMVDSVQLYVDTVHSLIEPGDEVEYEVKLDLRHIPGMEFGTGDCVIYKPKKLRIVIVDLKYGKGVPVDAEDNPQTRSYALGAARRYHNRGLDWIESVIVQPRCPHPEGSVRREVIDALDLTTFRIELEAAAAATMVPDAPLNPGDWCRFCPAAATCPALRGKVLETAEMEFSSTPPDASTLDLEKMAQVLKSASIIKDWVKRVEEHAHQLARDGTPPTGFKLVWGRATRRWKDDEAAQKYLWKVLDLEREDIFVEPKIKSPAGIEKVIGSKRKAEIEDLWTSKATKTNLVPLDDPRPAAKAEAEEEFA